LELGFPTWVAKALLSLLSVPAAVTIALRTQNAQIELDETVKAAQFADDARAAEERAKVDKLAAEEREYQRKVADEERERKHELNKLKLAQKVSEKPVQVSVSSVKVSNFPETFGKWQRWPKVPDEQRRRIASMTVEQVMNEYGIEERLAYLWINYAKEWVVNNGG
jgi:hypothetical protein